MLDNLTQRLAKVVKTMRGEARLTEANTADMLREVRLAQLEGLSYAEIAARLNVSASSVKQYLTRANRQVFFALPA